MPNWVHRVMVEKALDRPLVLLFDYDGTLAPLVSHPRYAAMLPTARESLAALASVEDVRIAVVSGRALGSVKSLVGIHGVWYAGSNGMHIDVGSEQRVDSTIAAFDPVADALMTALEGPVKWFPGTWIERKPGCLSLHYRSLLPLMAACFVEEVQDVLKGLEPACPPLRVRPVSKAIEVALADSWTKGNAITWMLMRCPARAFPVFVCDGANDEEGVAIVNARGGLTIGVGPDAPVDVTVRLATPRDLSEELAYLARLLAAPAPCVVRGMEPEHGGRP